MKKTKIVCTVGPSCSDVSTLVEMMEAGMNVARLNFAHGSYEEYKQQIDNIRVASKKVNVPVAILIDIKGPEIRIGTLQEKSYVLKENDTIILTTDIIKGDNTKVSVNHPGFIKDVRVGTSVLIDDGSMQLEVVSIENNNVFCRILNNATLKPRKGVNLPGINVSLPGVTERDIEHIKFGVDNEIDFIAASFVRKAEDIEEIKALLKQLNAEHIQIISKIENQEGIDNFDDILEISDGIMVARGDLGVEIPIEDVPMTQKIMIKKCNDTGKPVITATQMLDSMQVNPRPTRAEASDVANAILDGTDAIMLSGETAAGLYPVESVQTMTRIAQRIEVGLPYEKEATCNFDVTEAIAQASITAAIDVNASVIITPTETGYTARMVSKYRPKMPILAVAHDEHTLRSLSLVAGVTPIKGELTSSIEELLSMSIEACKREGVLKDGETVVITAGYNLNETGATNLLKIEKV